jgi:hypothetical protein
MCFVALISPCDTAHTHFFNIWGCHHLKRNKTSRELYYLYKYNKLNLDKYVNNNVENWSREEFRHEMWNQCENTLLLTKKKKKTISIYLGKTTMSSLIYYPLLSFIPKQNSYQLSPYLMFHAFLNWVSLLVLVNISHLIIHAFHAIKLILAEKLKERLLDSRIEASIIRNSINI